MVGIKVEGKQPRKEQMVVTWNQGLLGPQTTQGSFCGSTLVFVSCYCEDWEARAQLKEVRNVREASAVWRGVKWHRVSQKPRKEPDATRAKKPPRRPLPSGEKCLFHKVGLPRSREEGKRAICWLPTLGRDLRPNSVCFVRQMSWLHCVGVVSPPWWAQVWHRKWDINSLIPGPWEQTGGTETTNVMLSLTDP